MDLTCPTQSALDFISSTPHPVDPVKIAVATK